SNTTGGRCYRVTAVCVLLLCVLLLSAVTVLWIKFTNLTIERDQLQTSYNNLSIERDQLQTSYNNLTIERNQLLMCYKHPPKERDQCQSDYMSDVIKQGWRFCSSSLYYISTEKKKKNWTESRQDCRERGADLEFIITQLGDSKEAWIGLSKDVTEGKWKWLDGTELTNSSG
ncbi:antigen like protein, partial [Clarias magur]